MRRRTNLSLAQVLGLLMVPLMVYLGFQATRKVMEAYALWRQAEELRQEIEQLKARNAELRRQIEYLRSDAYVEKVAREQLDMIKPGDVPIVVVYPTPAISPSATISTPTPVPRPLWQEWLDRAGGAFELFKGIRH